MLRRSFLASLAALFAPLSAWASTKVAAPDRLLKITYQLAETKALMRELGFDPSRATLGIVDIEGEVEDVNKFMDAYDSVVMQKSVSVSDRPIPFKYEPGTHVRVVYLDKDNIAAAMTRSGLKFHIDVDVVSARDPNWNAALNCDHYTDLGITTFTTFVHKGVQHVAT